MDPRGAANRSHRHRHPTRLVLARDSSNTGTLARSAVGVRPGIAPSSADRSRPKYSCHPAVVLSLLDAREAVMAEQDGPAVPRGRVTSTRVQPGGTGLSPVQPQVNTTPVRRVDLEELARRLHAVAHPHLVVPAGLWRRGAARAHPLDVPGRVGEVGEHGLRLGLHVHAHLEDVSPVIDGSSFGLSFLGLGQLLQPGRPVAPVRPRPPPAAGRAPPGRAVVRRLVPTRRSVRKPAARRIVRCWLIAGQETSNWAAISPAESSRSQTSSRIRSRRGAAITCNGSTTHPLPLTLCRPVCRTRSAGVDVNSI